MDKQRNLWRDAFGDTERYMDFYFSEKARRSTVFSDFEGQELASMAFFTPYTALFYGNKIQAEYIVGVATAEKYRRQHRMKKLLESAIADRAQKGVDIVFLSPENPRVYESLGFVPVYDRVTTRAEGAGEKKWDIRYWRELPDQVKRTVSQWADSRLKEESLDFYLEHSPAYYDEADRELKALDGELVTFWNRDEPAAVCHVIREEEIPEVTELITERGQAEETLLTLLYYLKQGCVNVTDSYFLSETNPASENPVTDGQGHLCRTLRLTRIPQEKPMIMYRYTSEKEPEAIRCYINDIT